MVLNNWPFVALSILAVGLTPGPSMLFGFATGIQAGFTKSLYAGAGVLSALLVYAMLSLSGLGALLLAAPRMMGVLQWAGACYLGWLGVNALYRFLQSKSVRLPKEQHYQDLNARALFQRGLLTGLTNPKAVLFFSAVFPLFLDPALPFALQGWLLTVTFAMGWSVAFFCYSLTGAMLKTAAGNSPHNRFLNLITGVVYISAAGVLAWRR